jgi:hypothetical protein
MHNPGPKHFFALNHVLHHFRCHPARPLMYYHQVSQLPLASLLHDASQEEFDPTLVYFTNSAFADCDNGRSTGCYIGLFQGGVVDMSSSVPTPIANSIAEAETSYASVTCLAMVPVLRAYMEIEFQDIDRSYSVPLLTDSQATIDISRNDRGSSKTKHMLRRQLIVRQMVKSAYVTMGYVKGIQHQLADIGTKGDIPAAEEAYKFSILEAPFSRDAIAMSLPPLHANRRGVSESGIMSNKSSHQGTPDVSITRRPKQVRRVPKVDLRDPFFYNGL